MALKGEITLQMMGNKPPGCVHAALRRIALPLGPLFTADRPPSPDFPASGKRHECGGRSRTEKSKGRNSLWRSIGRPKGAAAARKARRVSLRKPPPAGPRPV